MTMDPVLRRAVDDDAAAVADVWPRSFAAALPTVRRGKTDDEVREYIARVVVPERETWVADSGGEVAEREPDIRYTADALTGPESHRAAPTVR